MEGILVHNSKKLPKHQPQLGNETTRRLRLEINARFNLSHLRNIYICETSIQSKHEKIKFKSNTADGGYFLSKCGKSKSE